nr:immunoglobulin light chain junction region [Macaca mulatta]MOV76643.1 immunoglobulin light chain junction region [Macaca mulatta]MOV76931.1 immunoglobulin light chain junction region [Macaca mulatta]MOW07947.1 immunoglobulin light chain junction region [Macaca mulatta]MOW08048.1 immunoglobulin light chain junction region [Macaca mulatta]
CMQGLEFPFSF